MEKMSEKEYEAEDDMRILILAYKIKKDKKRLSAAMKVAAKKREELGDLTKGEMKNG